MKTFLHNLSVLSLDKTSSLSEWIALCCTKDSQKENRCICSRHINNKTIVVNMLNGNHVQMGSACIKRINKDQGGNLATTKTQIEKRLKQAMEKGSFDPGRFTQIHDLPQYAKDVLAQLVSRKLADELSIPGVKSRDSKKLLQTALSNGKLIVYIYDEYTNERTVYLSQRYDADKKWILHQECDASICYTPKNIFELPISVITDILMTTPFSMFTQLNIKTSWYNWGSRVGDSILRYYNMNYIKDYKGNVHLNFCECTSEPRELGDEIKQLKMTSKYGYLVEDCELLQELSGKTDTYLELYYTRKNGILKKGHPWQALEYERHESEKENEIWEYEKYGPEDLFFIHPDEEAFWEMDKDE